MVERREPKPMEIQSFHSETDGAKPMAPVPSKRGRAPRTTARAIARSQADTTRKRSLKKRRSILHDWQRDRLPEVSGCFHGPRIAFGLLVFVGYHVETHQLSWTKSRRDGDIRGVASLRDHDAPNPWMVMSGIEGEPVPVANLIWPAVDRESGDAVV
jgi:hypothetical protein